LGPLLFMSIFQNLERRHQKGGTLEVLGDETLESLFNPVRLPEVWTAIQSLSKLPPPPPLFVSIFQNSERRQPKECDSEVVYIRIN
jgi:hypothetical protein